MASGLFGWDLLYNSVEKDIKNDQDILVCLTHLVLISKGFKCIGLGESKHIDGSETKTESLPKGWNEEYAIRYIFQGKLYNLKGTNLDESVILNLVRVDERTVGSLQLNARQVLSRKGTLPDMIPESEDIVAQIQSELIDRVVISTRTQDNATQTPAVDRGSGIRSTDPFPMFPFAMPDIGRSLVQPYGRSDLDPFGFEPRNPGRIGVLPGGGGMIFNPPRPSFPPGNLGVPPGSLPPGARFDPFRPPDGGPNPRAPRRPDNDEFPPPGYDDMFM
ncbi:hypothetical protein GWI33_004913 [Rhynchophorus ferrugineus]|uniref:Proteasome inhibitor PI31 subunit n=1 Tax=Rhynchophorus ferrugineus TaxID=354439 RepID=A0A834IUW9_RHYFE|nr:hypothetical protein GWI33_004913 [Rhynchophorus ferrugineus]